MHRPRGVVVVHVAIEVHLVAETRAAAWTNRNAQGQAFFVFGVKQRTDLDSGVIGKRDHWCLLASFAFESMQQLYKPGIPTNSRAVQSG